MYLTIFLRNCMWHNITTSTEMIFGTLYSILTFTAHISTLSSNSIKRTKIRD